MLSPSGSSSPSATSALEEARRALAAQEVADSESGRRLLAKAAQLSAQRAQLDEASSELWQLGALTAELSRAEQEIERVNGVLQLAEAKAQASERQQARDVDRALAAISREEAVAARLQQADQEVQALRRSLEAERAAVASVSHASAAAEAELAALRREEAQQQSLLKSHTSQLGELAGEVRGLTQWLLSLQRPESVHVATALRMPGAALLAPGGDLGGSVASQRSAWACDSQESAAFGGQRPTEPSALPVAFGSPTGRSLSSASPNTQQHLLPGDDVSSRGRVSELEEAVGKLQLLQRALEVCGQQEPKADEELRLPWASIHAQTSPGTTRETASSLGFYPMDPAGRNFGSLGPVPAHERLCAPMSPSNTQDSPLRGSQRSTQDRQPVAFDGGDPLSLTQESLGSSDRARQPPQVRLDALHAEATALRRNFDDDLWQRLRQLTRGSNEQSREGSEGDPLEGLLAALPPSAGSVLSTTTPPGLHGVAGILVDVQAQLQALRTDVKALSSKPATTASNSVASVRGQPEGDGFCDELVRAFVEGQAESRRSESEAERQYQARLASLELAKVQAEAAMTKAEAMAERQQALADSAVAEVTALRTEVSAARSMLLEESRAIQQTAPSLRGVESPSSGRAGSDGPEAPPPHPRPEAPPPPGAMERAAAPHPQPHGELLDMDEIAAVLHAREQELALLQRSEQQRRHLEAEARSSGKALEKVVAQSREYRAEAAELRQALLKTRDQASRVIRRNEEMAEAEHLRQLSEVSELLHHEEAACHRLQSEYAEAEKALQVQRQQAGTLVSRRAAAIQPAAPAQPAHERDRRLKPPAERLSLTLPEASSTGL